MRRYLSLRQVATAIGKDEWWMHRHIRRLIRDHGFPPRDAAMGGWDEGSLRAWQDARLTPAQRAALGIAEPSPAAAIQIALSEDVDLGAELDRRADDLFNAEAAQ